MRPFLRNSIAKLYLILGFQSMMVGIPIIVLFLQENGLSLQEVLLLQSVLSM
ncbi:hypothetical protein KKC44_01825 [Patescibacteria group bacterium]|nr:hypothetical protein [Patescibacteria group bacterium]MBU2259321.1 hypothetical protein [Patescibacteria group bacterium]